MARMIISLSAERARHEIEGPDGFTVLSGAFEAHSPFDGVVRTVAEILPDAQLVPQSADGELQHVVRAPDPARAPTAMEARFPPSTRHMELHTDGAYLEEPGVDYVALACVGQGRWGGATVLLTGAALLEHVMSVDQAAAKRLVQLFPFSALEARTPDDIVWHPVLTRTPRGIEVRLHRFRMQQAFARAGYTDDGAAKALDIVGAVLFEHANHVRLRLAPGELLVIDNRRVLHGREPFVDGDGERREMVRVWFRRRGRVAAVPTER